jgi:hypothetical protein
LAGRCGRPVAGRCGRRTAAAGGPLRQACGLCGGPSVAGRCGKVLIAHSNTNIHFLAIHLSSLTL